MSIIHQTINRKEGDKCPWCNTTDVVKGKLVVRLSKGGVKYFTCDRKSDGCKFVWRETKKTKFKQRNSDTYGKGYRNPMVMGR